MREEARDANVVGGGVLHGQGRHARRPHEAQDPCRSAAYICLDFKSIFSKLTQYGFDGWAVLEWECCLKDSAQGAAEGAPFIASHIIEPTKHAFDDFAGAEASEERNRRILGLKD